MSPTLTVHQHLKPVIQPLIIHAGPLFQDIGGTMTKVHKTAGNSGIWEKEETATVMTGIQLVWGGAITWERNE
jgi:hypothetical protein